jgi:hypothetical protein
VSSLQTAFQTTRGARITNSELAWHNVSALAGASRTVVRGAFKYTRGTVSGARRRTRHAGEAAQGQRSKSAFSTWRGPPCSRGLRGHYHRSCDGLAVLAQLANRADCQHVTG